MGEPILMVEYLRGGRPLRADVTPACRAVRVTCNPDDPVALHMDKDLADAMAAPARRSDDASGRTHRSLSFKRYLHLTMKRIHMRFTVRINILSSRKPRGAHF